METLKSSSSSSSSSPNLYKLLRTISKILRLKTRQNKTPKIKFHSNVKDSSNPSFGVPSNQLLQEENEKLRCKKALEALLAKLFASISTIKASYAQLQIAQSPYDPEEIQLADELVVTELKYLSELKQSLLKKQVDESPQVSILLAMVKEQKSVLKSYEITGKKFDSQFKLKDSEILFLKEKLEEVENQNEVLEKQLDPNPVGFVSVLDNLELSELNAKHFMILLGNGIKSVRSFVKLIVSEMSSAGWDLDAAVESIEPGVVYAKLNERHLALESFVCRNMFEGFQYPSFCTSSEGNEKQHRQGREQCPRFFNEFTELRFTNAMEMLKVKPGCSFGKFCKMKYLGLVHPKMELAFFGDLNQRNVVNSGGYPETHFFSVFAEMAKHIWLLYTLAYSFDPAVTIFQVRKGSRFSEVFMENVVEEDMDDPPVMDPRVGFTVVPGFKIGNTVIQCQVYLSSGLNHGE